MESEKTPDRAAPAANENPARAAIDRPFDPVSALSQELSLPAFGVGAVVKLLAEGATVPFISRYRKEATGGLDEVAIRAIEERRLYLLELDERRKTVAPEIDRQGKLSSDLAKRILGCTTKAELEDLYLPYKPKRRTRATIARERGLEPLADRIWAQPKEGDPSLEALAFVSEEKGVADALAALSGARDICAERIAEKPEVRKLVRDAYAKEAVIRVHKEKEHEEKVTKFDMYATFEEPIATIPSHRFLAIRRGEAEGVLRGLGRLQVKKPGVGFLGAFGDAGDEGREASAERDEDGVDLAGGHAGFVFVEEGVVELAAGGDAVALGLAACEGHDFFEPWGEEGKIGLLAGFLPGVLSKAGGLGQLGDELAGELGGEVVVAAHLAEIGGDVGV